MPPTDTAQFTDLLHDAVTKPGTLHAAYTAFHNFSLGNQLLALAQCQARELSPGPLATFPAWKDRGRYVRKGEKALTLCMPLTCKRREAGPDDAGDDRPEVYTRFVYKPHWFVLAQTDGADYQPEPPADWDADRALAALEITRIPFAMMDGNCQGYASKRQIAVSPVAALPLKTTFHECAHILLGHTAEQDHQDGDQTPRNLREVEAEAVALLCVETLGLDGAEYARGYLQHWLQSETIPESSARKIFKAADQLLKAGRPAEVK